MSAPRTAPTAGATAVASGGDPLNVIRTENAPADRTLPSLCNHDTGRALLHRTVGVNLRDLTWSHAVQQLAAGVTVTLDCGPTPKEQRRHRLRFHPDGTITLLDHPDGSSGDAQHSGDLNLAALTALHTSQAADPTEQAALDTMRALGAHAPQCATVALWLTGTQSDPTSALAHAGETFEVTTTFVGRHRYGPLLPLYTAVAWAQHPFWPRGADQRFLTRGITPTVLRMWVGAGWSVNDAIHWLNHGATLPVAEQWRAVGRTDGRSARLAAVGEHPDSEDAWLQAGFKVGESDPWRARKAYGQIPRLEAEEAYYWHRHGVSPNSVRDFKALATDEAGAEEQTRIRLGRRSMKHLDGAARGAAMPTLQRALEWTSAGVPSCEVLAWCTVIGTDDTALALAREWCRAVPSREIVGIADWNTTHPDAALTPAEVTRLRRLGIATDAETMSRASAYSSQTLMRPVQMLMAGKRWYGRDLRRVLTEAAAEQSREGGARPWKGLASTPQHILHDNWQPVYATLRNIWDLNNTPTWRVVLDWLDTNPTPPAPYRNSSH